MPSRPEAAGAAPAPVRAQPLSLRTHLLLWLVAPLLLAGATNLWSSRIAADRIADLVTDRTLVASSRAIGEATRASEGSVDAVIPPVAIEMFAGGFGDRVYYRVETETGRLLAGYPDLPMPPALDGYDPAFYGGLYRDRPVRLVGLRHHVAGDTGTASVTAIVGVTLGGHAAMAWDIWRQSLVQQALLILLAAGLAIFGLSRGLRPLEALSARVRRREAADLAPLDPTSVQSELRPLVVALNESMARVTTQMAAQSRFVQNAAHQLRTPIATLTTQATFALRTSDAADRTDALAGLRTSAMQLARLAAQLLLLARAEPGSRRPRRDAIELADAARVVLESLSAKALDRGIDLGLETEGGSPALVEGDGMMLREMLANLVDNAIVYSPRGSSVTVRIGTGDAGAAIDVVDTGPGVPDAERGRVFERFYRAAGTLEEGSGLGLAIVREIVEAAGGRVALSETPGGGLTVSVRLPLGRRGMLAKPAHVKG